MANSTQLISLPRKWAQQFNVRKGDELEIEEEGNQLIIKTEGAPDTKEIAVDVSGLTPRLADRFLARAYQKGYDSIKIRYDKPEVAIAIRNKVNELIGFEVLEHDKNTIYINSISSKLNIDFDTSLKKAFLIMIDMAKICLDAYSRGDAKELENLHYRDLELNKFCYFCLRFMNKGFRGGFGTHILYYLIEILEDAGDEYKALAQHLSRTPMRKKSIIAVMQKVNVMSQLAYEFFYTPDKEKAVSAMNLYDEIRGEIRSLFSTKDISEVAALNCLDTITRIMYHYPTMRLDTLKGLGG
ncbi:TPA: AbrB/MazE/SpoVT family DNA-binding domain-containing protein [Candidatus Woesearchaeota archaeon]|nr:AbrB/MazE/SpoVT family DNA-binding domain-containing protein [Candidatus Woesearchaeota archaeon]